MHPVFRGQTETVDHIAAIGVAEYGDGGAVVVDTAVLSDYTPVNAPEKYLQRFLYRQITQTLQRIRCCTYAQPFPFGPLFPERDTVA